MAETLSGFTPGSGLAVIGRCGAVLVRHRGTLPDPHPLLLTLEGQSRAESDIEIALSTLAAKDEDFAAVVQGPSLLHLLLRGRALALVGAERFTGTVGVRTWNEYVVDRTAVVVLRLDDGDEHGETGERAGAQFAVSAGIVPATSVAWSGAAGASTLVDATQARRSEPRRRRAARIRPAQPPQDEAIDASAGAHNGAATTGGEAPNPRGPATDDEAFTTDVIQPFVDATADPDPAHLDRFDDDDAEPVPRPVGARLTPTTFIAALPELEDYEVVDAPAKTVRAVACPMGHPNPTHADECRLCGAAIVDRATATVDRPPAGRLVFDDGSTIVSVDGPIVIGRDPSADGFTTEEPTLVSIDNPALEATQCAVWVDGWEVRVRDVAGTRAVFMSQSDRQRSRITSDPVALPPGAHVTLSDAVSFRFEPV